VSTFRLQLTNEQTGAIAFEHVHIPETSVRTVEKFLRDNIGFVTAAAGAVQAARGIKDAIAGMETAMQAGSVAYTKRRGPRR